MKGEAITSAATQNKRIYNILLETFFTVEINRKLSRRYLIVFGSEYMEEYLIEWKLCRE